MNRYLTLNVWLLWRWLMVYRFSNCLVAIFLAVYLLSLSTQSYAQKMQTQLPSGMLVNAEYLPGDKAKPGLLVLHGFLQNYEFMSTRNIINGLASLGYTVLAPNISLGVPNRQQSMQCSAIHTHTMESDLKEIAYWVEWLKQQGHQSVIIVGHSWGSQHGLGYLELHPDPAIKAVIAISLVRPHQTPEQNASQIEKAERRIANNDQALYPYALSFCKEYMSNPHSYLSYARWDDARVTHSLSVLKKQDFPVYAIIGSSDKRIDPQWLQELQKRVTMLAVVEGANHFFSHVHEFDLNDRLEAILEEIVK